MLKLTKYFAAAKKTQISSLVFKSWTLTFQKNIFAFFIESPLEMMKNTFYFMLKVLFVLEIFSFLSRFFGFVEKRLDNAMVDFKIFDGIDCTTNNYNTYLAQYLKN